MSKLTLLVFVVSLLACTYAATKVTNDPIPVSAIPPPWYMIPVHPNKQSASIYGDGVSTSLEDQNKSLIVVVLDTAYSYTLQPIVNIISSVLSVFLAPFNYVGSFIGLTKTPPPEKQRLRRQAGPEPDADTESTSESDPDSESDTESTAVQEFDINSLSDLAMISIKFVLNTYEYIMEWIEIVMDTLNAGNDIDFNQLFELNDVDLDEVMDYMMSMAQEIAIRISLRLWTVIKSDLLPLLDAAIVEFQDSDIFSEDVRQMLLSVHSAYQMAHLIGVI